MINAKTVFFGIIALALATATVLQFVIVYELEDICKDSAYGLTTAPAVAGICLAGSFIANTIWLWARGKDKSGVQSAAILLWTLSVLFGVTAAGATLGQIQLYEDACHETGNSNTNFNAIQYASIALMFLSIAAPHSLKKDTKKNTGSKSIEGGPEVGSLESVQQPLVFL